MIDLKLNLINYADDLVQKTLSIEETTYNECVKDTVLKKIPRIYLFIYKGEELKGATHILVSAFKKD